MYFRKNLSDGLIKSCLLYLNDFREYLQQIVFSSSISAIKKLNLQKFFEPLLFMNDIEFIIEQEYLESKNTGGRLATNEEEYNLIFISCIYMINLVGCILIMMFMESVKRSILAHILIFLENALITSVCLFVLNKYK